jgi:hypothetical protein
MTEYAMEITYFDTLYNREATMRVFGKITFDNGSLRFASMGHRYSIPAERVISIEPIGEQ